MLRSLGLTLDSVQRLTWASTDLAVWPERSVVVLELAPGHDTDALAHRGEAADVGMADLPCRRIPGAAWPHPLLVVDRQTVVTGDESLLRALAQRPAAHLESAPMDRLLAAVAPDADAMLLVDLAAARAAHWKLPTALLDVWPAQKRLWHDLWETPVGAGLHPVLVRSAAERGGVGLRKRDGRREGPRRTWTSCFRRSNACCTNSSRRCRTPWKPAR